MLSHILLSRLKKELADLEKDPPPGIICYPKDDDITHLDAYIKGPPDSPYRKGMFRLEIRVPHTYPFDPPQIRFETPIYHPNIDESGRICADILKKGEKGGWKPSINLSTTLISLRVLMECPNPDDPLDADIAREFQLDHATFVAKAEEQTQRNATGKPATVPTEASTSEPRPMVATRNTSADTTDVYLMMATEKPKSTKPRVSLSTKKGKSSAQSTSSLSQQCSQEPVSGISSNKQESTLNATSQESTAEPSTSPGQSNTADPPVVSDKTEQSTSQPMTPKQTEAEAVVLSKRSRGHEPIHSQEEKGSEMKSKHSNDAVQTPHDVLDTVSMEPASEPNPQKKRKVTIDMTHASDSTVVIESTDVEEEKKEVPKTPHASQYDIVSPAMPPTPISLSVPDSPHVSQPSSDAPSVLSTQCQPESDPAGSAVFHNVTNTKVTTPGHLSKLAIKRSKLSLSKNKKKKTD